MAIFKRNNTWYIDYYVNGERKREKIGRSKKLAEATLKKMNVEVIEERYLDIKHDSRIAFSDIANQYLQIIKNRKCYKRRSLSIKELVAFFGDSRLNTITPSRIDNYKEYRLSQPSKRRLGENIAPATINRELACLKHIFNTFIKNGRIENNPMKHVELYKENNERNRVLSKEEFKRLLACSPDYLKDILSVGYYTGMRKGEILNLRWSRVDLQKGFIRLKPEDTKTNEGRNIPLNNILTEMLESYIRHINHDFVFTKNGKPIKNSSMRKDFEKAVTKANISDFVFHDLRHTCINNWRKQGHDYFKIMKASGHKTMTVFKRYNTVDEEELRSLLTEQV